MLRHRIGSSVALHSLIHVAKWCLICFTADIATVLIPLCVCSCRILLLISALLAWTACFIQQLEQVLLVILYF